MDTRGSNVSAGLIQIDSNDDMSVLIRANCSAVMDRSRSRRVVSGAWQTALTATFQGWQWHQGLDEIKLVTFLLAGDDYSNANISPRL